MRISLNNESVFSLNVKCSYFEDYNLSSCLQQCEILLLGTKGSQGG